MGDSALKICVVGPTKVGKTLLCRVVAEQPVSPGEYHPTAAVRIQEFSRQVGSDRVKIQLWDCSGNVSFENYWPLLSKEVDGVVLVIDAQHPEQEKDLETFYMNFAQPNNLTTKQCMILALNVQKEGSYGLVGWDGLSGKLNKLQQGFATINPTSPSQGQQEATAAFDRLISGCLTTKKEVIESSVVDGEAEE